MPETPSGEIAETRESPASRVFWQYWTASTISSTGTAVTAVALPLVAVRLLGASSFQVSLITAASYAAWVLIGLPAGVIVQRLPLRGTQVSMDLVRAAALASIPAASYFDRLHVAQLIVVALIVSLASVIFDVGNSTFLPSIVSTDELKSRNSLTSASAAATQLGGPSLGGVLVALFGAVTALVVDVVSYLLSAVLLQRLPRPAPRTTVQQSSSMIGLIRDGWRYVQRHQVIQPCMAAATSVNFVAGALMALTPVFLVRTLGAPIGLVGVLIASEGIGSLLGAAFTPWFAERVGTARATLLGSAAAALFVLLIPLTSHDWGLMLFAVGNAGFGAGVVVLSILTRTHRQIVTPPELLARVMATVRFVSWSAIPIGALTAGVAATWLGTREALWLVCVVCSLAPLVLWSSAVRRLRDLN